MNASAIVPPKKKDPYATAWRTYSKIAEELQLLNPDGSLYPISKEAILKYLHHQSKRIKSSNLHWYVNGLKKHQENLGFPWDDVRYDEQVVGLLKELTLHPVMMGESNGVGGDDEHHGYGGNRQRQASGGMYPLGAGVGSGRTGGHHYSSSSIDTTRIANLSISQPSPSHAQAQQHQQQQHGQAFVNVGLKQHHQSHQQYLQQQQQAHHHSQRIQQPPPPKPYYHSAPIQLQNSLSSSTVSGVHTRTPSTQDLAGPSGGMHQGRTAAGGIQQQQQYSQQQQQPLSNALRSEPIAGDAHVSSALSKRKRDDFTFKKRRMPSSMSIEGDDLDEDDLQDDDFKDDDDDDLDARRGTGHNNHHHHSHRGHQHDPDDSDEMEDSNRYQPLKRRASTGTLLNQARASAVKHVPGPFTVDEGHTQASSIHPHTASATSSSGAPQPHRTLHHRVSASGLSSTANRHHKLQSYRSHQNLHHHHQSSNVGQNHSQRQHHGRSPSPELRETTSSSHHHHRQHSSSMAESSDSQRFRHPSGGSGSVGAISGADTEAADPPSTSLRAPGGAATPAPTASAQVPIKAAGKTTVQFSDVVQCASQLQAMYGLRCKDHPWGCVEITEDRHLELTMKMYLDWAGLVASERLTMDELPDLPDFRDIHPRPLAGGPSGGGTLKRMSSTPLSSSLASIARGGHSSGIESSPPTATTVNSGEGGASEEEDEVTTTPTCTTTASYFGQYRSPSSSSPQSHTTTATTLAHEKDTPTSEDGPDGEGLVDHHRTRMSTASPPPHTILRPASAMARRSHPSSPGDGFTPSAGVAGERPMVLARARKMPSTPSLRQHRDHQYTDLHELYRHDSTLARHSQSPPPLPRSSPTGPSSSAVVALRGHLHGGSTVSEDLLSDEEDEEPEEDEDENEEEDEDVDVNHYALSPWATAPASVLADARLRGSRNMGPTARRPNTTLSHAGLSVCGSNADDDAKKARSGPRDGMNDSEEVDSHANAAMVLDPESSVLQIGDLASHRHTLLTPKGRGDDGVDEPVEVATHVLDSMMIGGRHRHRTESSSSSSSEVVAMDVDEDIEGGVSGGSKKEIAELSLLQQQQEQALKNVDGRKPHEQEMGLELPTTAVSKVAQSQNHNHQLQHPIPPRPTEKQHQVLQEQQPHSGETTVQTKPLPPMPPPESGLMPSTTSFLDNEVHRRQERGGGDLEITATTRECNDDVVM